MKASSRSWSTSIIPSFEGSAARTRLLPRGGQAGCVPVSALMLDRERPSCQYPFPRSMRAPGVRDLLLAPAVHRGLTGTASLRQDPARRWVAVWRSTMLLLCLIAALSGTPLRQAEASSDFARSRAEPGQDHVETIDGGVGDDAEVAVL